MKVRYDGKVSKVLCAFVKDVGQAHVVYPEVKNFSWISELTAVGYGNYIITSNAIYCLKKDSNYWWIVENDRLKSKINEFYSKYVIGATI